MHKIIQKSVIIALLFLTSCADGPAKKGTTANIAILMPISGQYAPLGQRAASMIELGLEDGLEGNIKIMTYDIDDEEKIASAITKMKSRGTKLVLGPIFSSQASDIASRIVPAGMSMITLSNNPAIATKGVYVFGHTPMKQTERIVNYMLDNSYVNYITLLPVGKYSNEISEIIGNMVAAKKGKLIHCESYTEQEESINVAVDNIAKIVESINELDEVSTKPVLYISDESIALQQVVEALKKRNLDISTVIIGDNKINIKYNHPITYLYTGSVEYQANDLIKRLGERIPNIKYLNYMDLMAYDLGRIVSHTIGEGLKHDQFLERLDSGHLYIGASGQIKFADHIAGRKYDIIKHHAGTNEIMDRAK